MPPWSYRIFEPNTKTATVRVRLSQRICPRRAARMNRLRPSSKFHGRMVAMSRHFSGTPFSGYKRCSAQKLSVLKISLPTPIPPSSKLR